MMTLETIPSIKHQKDAQIQKESLIDFDGSDAGNPVLRRVMSDLRTAQHEYGNYHNSVAEAWNALGLVRVHMQRDAKGAKMCHEEALRIYVSNKEHVETAITLNDLGYCHEQLGEHNQALQRYEEALTILSSLKLDESHPRMISTRRAVYRVRRE
jgi:tetratricopeptide (TPR) repeat protein